MNVLRRALWILIGIELSIAGVRAGQTLRREPPPRPDLSRFEPETAADLEMLLTQLDESDPASWQRLAEAYLAYGCLPEAELCFRRAATLDTQSALIFYGWASCLDRLGQLTESNRHYERAAQLPGSMPEGCWYRIGRNHLRNEDPTSADEALSRAGDFPMALYLRAKQLVRTGHVAEALPLIERLEAVSSTTIQSLQLRAELQRSRGQAEQAAEVLDRLERTQNRLDLNDQNAPLTELATRYGFFHRLNICSQLSDPARGMECARSIITGHPQEYRYLPKAAELAMNAGLPEQALEMLEEALRGGNLSPELLEQIGDTLSRLHRYDDAQAYWKRAVEFGGTVTVHGKLAESFRRQGDEESARRHDALQREAEGVAAYRTDALESAVSLLREAVALNPESPRAWFYQGEACRALSDFDAARAAYQACLELNPDYGRALAGMERLPHVEAH